jgi:hypothetical protein
MMKNRSYSAADLEPELRRIGFRRRFLMNQNRTEGKSVPDRSSDMEQAEGSRESVLNSENMGGERMRGSESERAEGRQSERMRGSGAGKDLGSSSDRAMFEERGSAESRVIGSEHGIGTSTDSSTSDVRGSGSSGERNAGSSGDRSSNTGGITNRPLDREQSEQEELPERGRSQSER